jgi:hypothetical protein
MVLRNRLVKVLALFFVFLNFSVLASSALAKDDAINTGRFNSTAINGYDTVAYFTQNKALKGDKKYQVKWRDANWFFSNEGNKALFIGDPEKYAPQYGGWCAYAMADEGSTARIDPEAFNIFEGKLYLNYNQKIQRTWLADRLNFVTKADHFYPQETNVTKFIKK